jgi:hypothetical protein
LDYPGCLFKGFKLDQCFSRVPFEYHGFLERIPVGGGLRITLHLGS